jgi:hypothetical protein
VNVRTALEWAFFAAVAIYIVARWVRYLWRGRDRDRRPGPIPEPWGSIAGTAIGGTFAAVVFGGGTARSFTSVVGLVMGAAVGSLFALWRRKRRAADARP